MINELIPPDTLTPALQKKLAQLNAALIQLKKLQKKQPPGHLRIAQKGGNRNYFYHYTSSDDFTGKYIRKNEQALAKALAQKDYNIKLIKQLENETQSLNEYLAQTKNGTAIPNLYKDLCPARQPLITPATLTDEQYTNLWKTITWQGRSITPDASQYDTAQGEKVRSKSEVIIADALARHGIPYRYEFPVKLHRNQNNREPVYFYPDFCCLNIHTRQEFFWEHFGLMDDEEYATNAAGKLRLYAENNIFPGRNLIITMETKEEPLNTKLIEKTILAFLK